METLELKPKFSETFNAHKLHTGLLK